MIRWLLGLSLSASASAGEVQAYFINREGIQALARQNNAQAYREFLKALEEAPLNAAVQMNLGYTYILNEEWEKAEQAFRGVLTLLGDERNKDARFQALFNIGVAASRQSKIDAALAAYQAALEIDPESKDVKTNIELLWQGQNGGGEGGGEGDSKDKDKKDKDKEQRGRPKDDPSQDEKQKEQEKKKPQPKPFESQELRQEDVKRILDEIKNQEQNIRAQEYERKGKDVPKGKDW